VSKEIKVYVKGGYYVGHSDKQISKKLEKQYRKTMKRVHNGLLKIYQIEKEKGYIKCI
jgi:DNA-directed RNA polymerase specialized sigma24 family protein